MGRNLMKAVAAAVLTAGLVAAQQSEPGQGKQQQPQQQDEGMRSEALQKVRQVVDNWDAQAWDEVLAEDVSLSLRIADMVQSPDGGSSLVSIRTEVRGRDKVKQALQKLYEGYHKQITIKSELLGQNQAVLMGDVKVGEGRERFRERQDGQAPQGREQQPREGQEAQKQKDDSVPFIMHMHFNQEGKIDRLNIASFDLKAVGQGRQQQQQTPEQR